MEKQLIDANVVLAKQFTAGLSDASGNYYGHANVVFVDDIENSPTVDAVPVDEIRVDFEQLCIVNQEAILNVSICGKPNEVKIPFSKEVAEVVHGRWEAIEASDELYRCSACGEWQFIPEEHFAYCPYCGAKMDGDGK